jgi:hypothetical protein
MTSVLPPRTIQEKLVKEGQIGIQNTYIYKHRVGQQKHFRITLNETPISFTRMDERF